MIMIDVLVPPIDETFDFEVDEALEVSKLRKEVEKLIAKRKEAVFGMQKRELFHYRLGDFLNEEESLQNQDIRNGDRLILI